MNETKIKPGDHYGKLTTRWCWNSKSGRVWKCICECGNTCYVKEVSLEQELVQDCGCSEKEDLDKDGSASPSVSKLQAR